MIYRNLFNYIILILLLSITISRAQDIKITISGSNNNAELFYIEGEKIVLIDSLRAKENIFVISSANYNLNKGLYRLSFNHNKWLNFVYDGDYIELRTNINSLVDSLVVINSRSNELYFQFLKLNKAYKTKTELLNLVLTRYPKNDSYYYTTQQKIIELIQEYRAFISKSTQTIKNSFIARYIRSSQLPILPRQFIPEDQLIYLKNHSLDSVDFNDAGLIYSDCFTNKSIEYLMYYSNPQLPKEMLEKEFMVAVDTLLSKAKVNILVYQHIAEYLIDGFKRFGFDKIIDYILENYVIADDLCLDEKLENSIQRRINQSKMLSIGSIAPNIVIPDIEGNIVDLKNIRSERILLLFYASWCPHCQEIIPRLNELYESQTNPKAVEVVAISLDENKEEWFEFVKDHKLQWLNVSDLQGWNGRVATDYSIYATPTMFLLDTNNKIIAKPFNLEGLYNIF